MVASKMAALVPATGSPTSSPVGSMAVQPAFSAAEGQAWRELIESRVGLYFSEARTHQLTSALWRRMREVGVTNYSTYLKMAAGPAAAGKDSEWNALLESLTNRETHFFRHEPTFKALREELLPKLITEKPIAEPVCIAIWSAGCSTGEEAYSTAMVCKEVMCKEAMELAPRTSCSILASDVSATALEKAAAARYRARAPLEVPERYRRYLAPLGEGCEGGVQVVPEIRSLVRWSAVNLVHEHSYPNEWFDIVMCQNVLVYFRPEARQKMVANLALRLKPGGYLLPGPGEIAGLDCPDLRCQCLDDMQVFVKQAVARA